MKLFRKIDPITGNFIEDVIFESHPTVLDAEGNTVLDAQYVEEAPKQGFYLPRWNGMGGRWGTVTDTRTNNTTTIAR